jgi:hypothetical protein
MSEPTVMVLIRMRILKCCLTSVLTRRCEGSLAQTRAVARGASL